jgi:hypothetical protein
MANSATNYLASAAREIRAEVSDDVLPKANTDLLFLMYAVLMFAKGERVTREDVHNAWTAWMLARGKDRPSMVEFDQLSPETQAEDQPFVDAIVKVAARYARGERPKL